MEEVRAAIVASQAFVFVISPDSAASKVCREEVEQAVAVGKRILPVVARKVAPDELPDAIAARNWVEMKRGDDLEAGVEALKAALDTDPEWAAQHTRLLVRASEWEQGGRDPSFALRGQDLARGEEWLTRADERKDPQPTRLQTEFIFASRRHATRGQRTRMVLLGVGMVIAVGLAAYALVQRGQAERRASEARSRELAATAVAQRQNNPELALLLAVKAAGVRHTAGAESALRETLADSYGRGALSSGSRQPLNAVATDDKGRLVATAGDSAQVWMRSNGKLLQTVDPESGAVTDVALNRSGRTLATSTVAGAVEIWDVGTGDLIGELPGMSRSVESVDISADGRLVAASGRSGGRVWTAGGEEVSRLRGHRGTVWSIAFSPSGGQVATAGLDGTVRIWDSRGGKLERTFTVGGAARTDVNSVEFSHDGEGLATASDDGKARVLDSRDGRVRAVLPASQTLAFSASFSPDDHRVVVGSRDGAARIWSVPKFQSDDAPRRGRLLRTLRGPAGEVRSATFAGDGQTVVTAHSDGVARVWGGERADVAGTLPHPVGVLDAVFSPDGKRVLTAAEDGYVRVWDADSASLLKKIRVSKYTVWTVQFSRDGREFVTASDDGAAGVWSYPDGRRVRRLEPNLKAAYSAVISPDGRYVAAIGIGGGRIWDLDAGGEPVRFAVGKTNPFDVAFSPNGRMLATVGLDGKLRYWNASDGSEVEAIPAHRGKAYAVVFDPAGDRLATAGADDRTARLWDVGDQTALRSLSAHSGGVLNVAFSPDGEELATSSQDKTVGVWGADSGALLDRLRGPKAEVNSVAYGPVRTRIVAASADHRAYLMRCSICIPYDRLLEIAQRRVDEALTAEEREQYLSEFGE